MTTCSSWANVVATTKPYYVAQIELNTLELAQLHALGELGQPSSPPRDNTSRSTYMLLDGLS